MKMAYIISDERGDEVEAQIEQQEGDDPFFWRVVIWGPKGIRGMFEVTIPPGVDMHAALQREILERYIHAHN